MTPVTAVLERQVEFVPDPTEVARLLFVPVGELLDSRRWERKRHEYRGSAFDVWHFPYDQEDVWGLTGSILHDLVEYLWMQGARPDRL